MIDFCINCYLPYWINCTVASVAPGIDLDLLITLQKYKSTDKLCAASALSDMKNHVWYLVKELVPFSLFDDYTIQSVKAKVLNHQNFKLSNKSGKAPNI